MANEAVEMPDWAGVMGRVPSGIFIVTVRQGEQETGLLASWVMQAGFEPPMLSVAVNRKRYVAQWLSDGAPLVVNLVGEGQTQFLKHFGRGFEIDQPAFEGLALRRTPRGGAILADALGYLDCTPFGHADAADHRIFLARVESGELLQEIAPMVHVRKNGTRY